MEIIENEYYIEVIKDDKIYHYNKSSKEYDYRNLAISLSDLDIKNVRIGINSCNIVSKKSILKRLKSIFGKNKVSFTGSYKDKIYQYNIKLKKEDI